MGPIKYTLHSNCITKFRTYHSHRPAPSDLLTRLRVMYRLMTEYFVTFYEPVREIMPCFFHRQLVKAGNLPQSNDSKRIHVNVNELQTIYIRYGYHSCIVKNTINHFHIESI